MAESKSSMVAAFGLPIPKLTSVGTAVSQAVSTVLENYLEENPREAKAIVDKVILAATRTSGRRKSNCPGRPTPTGSI